VLYFPYTLTSEADVTDAASLERYVQRARAGMGGIHAFFNSAGIAGNTHPLSEYPLAGLQKVIAMHVSGVCLGVT
jgi:NAD(P)-dependent dehydrogenase (short-subunit alcohol dehydrogenase family)